MTAAIESVTLGTVDRRGLRWMYRHWLWEHSTVKRVKACGRRLYGDRVDLVVGVRDGKSVGSWRGVGVCGSTWACPVCTSRISEERTAQIGAVLDTVRGAGSLVVMVTFTVRHKGSDSLAKVWRAVAQGWSAATSGRAWDQVRTVWSPGYVRALEVTHTDNGWHVHVHAALVLPKFLADYGDEIAGSVIYDIVEGMWSRWDGAATRAGLRPGLRSVGSDWRVVTAGENIADYLGKWGLETEGWGAAQELGMWDAKKGRKDSRSPWQILAGLADGSAVDEAGDLAIWREWEKVSQGKRRIHTSRGFWDLAAVVVRTDEEIAEDSDAQADDVVVMTVGRKDFRLITDARCDWLMMDWAAAGRGAECLELLRLLRLRSFQPD